MDPASTAPQGFGALLSHLFGWAYFFAWSASFYPQAILNWRRRSVQGLSMDYLYLNVLGFICYSIFNLSFFFSSAVQEEYRGRNNGQDNLVRANDVFFAVHAFIMSSFTLLQTFFYKRDRGQVLSIFARLFIILTALGAGVLFIAVITGSFQRIDLLYYLSYIKLGITFLKYSPQVYANYRAQSTVGWSIHSILFDIAGGIFSTAQLVLDAYYAGDWSGISGDLVKFGLGLFSIFFDLIFMTQHFILYRNREDFYVPVSTAENHHDDISLASMREPPVSRLPTPTNTNH
ncbi:MAG: putative L-cystine transporter [Benniella sp.]|nr:MAG: putative L-cystine transporter [Benniella sp.]